MIRTLAFAGGLLTLLAALGPLTAQTRLTPDKLSALDAIATRLDASLGTGLHPGAALAVLERGEVLWFKGVGLAQIENEVPISRKSNFRLASTSKQFTAAAIALLESRGELDLDASVRTWFPKLPAYSDAVTVRHLVHHTSGLRDYLRLHYFEGIRDHEVVTPKNSLAMIERQASLAFTPGDRFDYSNTNYLLLAEIVARVSKQSFAKFVEQELFAPLAMTSSRVSDDRNAIIPQRTAAYQKQRGGWRRSVTQLEHVGDGGVFSNIDDLSRWDAHFYRPTLGQDGDLVKLQRRKGPFDDYAFGLIRTQFNGHSVEMHGGAFVGYRADLIRFPDLGLSFVCLANYASCNPTRVAFDLARAAGIKPKATADKPPVADGPPPRKRDEPKAEKAPIPAGLAAAAKGLWQSPEFEKPCRVGILNDTLYLYFGRNPVTLPHASGPEFGAEDFKVTFILNKEGRPRAMHLSPDGGPPHVYRLKPTN